MPRDITIAGDGHFSTDTLCASAVSTPSPVRKRGRPRKAKVYVNTTPTMPTGVPIAETPHETAAGGGHAATDTQNRHASPPSTAVAVLDAGGGGEVRVTENMIPSIGMTDLVPLITSIVLDQKKRRFCIRSQNRQDNATLAFVRMYLGWSPDLPEKDQKKILDRAASIVDKVEKGKPLPEQDQPIGDACALLILSAASARKPIDELRKSIEKSMERSAKQLPVWEWASGVKGFGAVGLAVVIGEAGADLHEFANPGKLWKRMGLAPLRGKSAKTWRLEGGLTAEDWTWYGYKPARRSEMWNRVPPLVKAQISKVLDADGEDAGERIGTGPYGQAYLDRKKYELERDPEMSKMHAHNRAARYMEKRLLKHLWQAWRRQPITD